MDKLKVAYVVTSSPNWFGFFNATASEDANESIYIASSHELIHRSQTITILDIINNSGSTTNKKTWQEIYNLSVYTDFYIVKETKKDLSFFDIIVYSDGTDCNDTTVNPNKTNSISFVSIAKNPTIPSSPYNLTFGENFLGNCYAPYSILPIINGVTAETVVGFHYPVSPLYQQFHQIYSNTDYYSYDVIYHNKSFIYTIPFNVSANTYANLPNVYTINTINFVGPLRSTLVRGVYYDNTGTIEPGVSNNTKKYKKEFSFAPGQTSNVKMAVYSPNFLVSEESEVLTGQNESSLKYHHAPLLLLNDGLVIRNYGDFDTVRTWNDKLSEQTNKAKDGAVIGRKYFGTTGGGALISTQSDLNNVVKINGLTLTGVTLLAMTYNYTLALKQNPSSIHIWGTTYESSQEFVGTPTGPQTMVPAGLCLATIKDIQGSFDNFCALNNDGTVVCWGENQWGQSRGTSADGTNITDSPTGQAVRMLGITLTGVTKIVPGTMNHYAITGGKVVGWGNYFIGPSGATLNGINQGSQSNGNNYTSYPIGISFIQELGIVVTNVVDIHAGWDINQNGGTQLLTGILGDALAANNILQLYNNSRSNRFWETNRNINGVVATKSDNTFSNWGFFWGNRAIGLDPAKVGDTMSYNYQISHVNNYINTIITNPVSGLFSNKLLPSFRKLSSGGVLESSHLCGITNNKIYCIGTDTFYTDNSQVSRHLGTNEVDISLLNIPDLNYIDVVCGKTHNLAITSNNNVVGWGSNDFGECRGTTFDGNPITITSSNLVKILGVTLQNVIKVSVGDNFSVALKSDKTTVAWGVTSFNSIPNSLSANYKFDNILSNNLGTFYKFSEPGVSLYGFSSSNENIFYSSNYETSFSQWPNGISDKFLDNYSNLNIRYDFNNIEMARYETILSVKPNNNIFLLSMTNLNDVRDENLNSVSVVENTNNRSLHNSRNVKSLKSNNNHIVYQKLDNTLVDTYLYVIDGVIPEPYYVDSTNTTNILDYHVGSEYTIVTYSSDPTTNPSSWMGINFTTKENFCYFQDYKNSINPINTTKIIPIPCTTDAVGLLVERFNSGVDIWKSCAGESRGKIPNPAGAYHLGLVESNKSINSINTVKQAANNDLYFSTWNTGYTGSNKALTNISTVLMINRIKKEIKIAVDAVLFEVNDYKSTTFISEPIADILGRYQRDGAITSSSIVVSPAAAPPIQIEITLHFPYLIDKVTLMLNTDVSGQRLEEIRAF